MIAQKNDTPLDAAKLMRAHQVESIVDIRHSYLLSDRLLAADDISEVDQIQAILKKKALCEIEWVIEF